MLRAIRTFIGELALANRLARNPYAIDPRRTRDGHVVRTSSRA
ncbi:hypothetical protein [Palleronia rufa]|nr:hypothetical protein [Palleronia rufa]